MKKPRVLVASVMCTHFSGIMAINYGRMSVAERGGDVESSAYAFAVRLQVLQNKD